MVECIIITTKLLLFPWVTKNTGEGGNMISHLLFFLIGAPEMKDIFFG